jgi:hypothetical protein
VSANKREERKAAASDVPEKEADGLGEGGEYALQEQLVLVRVADHVEGYVARVLVDDHVVIQRDDLG